MAIWLVGGMGAATEGMKAMSVIFTLTFMSRADIPGLDASAFIDVFLR